MSQETQEPLEAGALIGDQTREPPLNDPAQTVAAAQAPFSVQPSSIRMMLPAQAYSVGREIAKGGMGCVLEAEDRKLSRVVAMKVMRVEASASDSARSRFVREAVVLARLEHPNIVPIHELGWDAQNQLYYTMKLVQGRTLQAVLNGLKSQDVQFLGHYTLDRLLTIFRKVCDAMSLAHAKGVIHRDLKPDNIMVGEFGEVLVMDWGLAKILGDPEQAAAEAATKAEALASGSADQFREMADLALRHSANLTMDGSVMGTPLYMSPEQAAGRGAEIDQQSDIFSLGGILYALLTLHPPVDGKTADEILSRIKRGEIVPPTAYNTSTKSGGKAKSIEGQTADPKKFQPLPHCPNGKIPSALSAVTMRALAIDKAKRYKTVAEIAADIESYQGGFATQAEQAGLLTQLRLLVQRHRKEFTVAFAAWFIITALAVWFVINLRASEKETRRQADIARQNESRAVSEAARAMTAEKTARDEATRATSAEQSAKASEAVAVQERESARQSQAKPALSLAEAARRDGNGPEMQAALADVPDDLRDSTWRYLLAQSDTSMGVIRPSGPEIYVENAVAVPRRPGVFVILESNSHVSMVDVHTGERFFEFEALVKRGGYDRDIAVSVDGRLVAVCRHADKETRIFIYSTPDGAILQQWTAPPCERLEFSPDGSYLIQEERNRRHLSVWKPAEGKLDWEYAPAHNPDRVFATFTPDGKQVITYGRGDGYRVVNIANGAVVRRFEGGLDPINPLALSDNLFLGSNTGYGRVTLFDVHGKVISDLRHGTRTLSYVGFAPGGEQLVTAVGLPDGRQEITVWRTSTGNRVGSLLGGRGAVRHAAIHPLTGELVVVGPVTRVWSLTGKPPAWELRSGWRPAFCGSDDLIFAYRGLNQCGLIQLQPQATALRWQIEGLLTNRIQVSGDGKVAILWHDSARKDEIEFKVLRDPGLSRQIIKTGRLLRGYDVMHLTIKGDRALAHERANLTIELLNTETGEVKATLNRTGIKRWRDAGWVDGEQQVVGLVTANAERGDTTSEERIVLWDAATGEVVKFVKNRTPMDVLAIAPDGKRFAEAGADRMVRIRDGSTLGVLREFRVHDGPITAIAWHPSKPIIATGSADFSIRLWNVETGRMLEEFGGSLIAPVSLTFSPSGQRLACLSDVTRVWEPQSLSDKPATTRPTTDAWQDLMETLTPEAVEGLGKGWRLEGGALFCPADEHHGSLALPGSFARCSYQVRVRLMQLMAKDSFDLHLPVGGHMANFVLDAFPLQDYYTGLNTVNGMKADAQPGSVHGKVIKDTEQHELEATVHVFDKRAVITVTLDGQPLFEWSGLAAALFDVSPGTPGVISVGSYAGGWVVYDVKAKRKS